MILLDSHILVWLDQGSSLLGKKARRVIENSFQQDDVAIASVTFWEISELIQMDKQEIERAPFEPKKTTRIVFLI